MSKSKPRIIGTGWAVPTKVRLNDDPIFDWIRHNLQDPKGELFFGYNERHVLDTGETLLTIMAPAARMAMQNAGVEPSDIDLLIGLGSISENIEPNMLTQLHHELGLPEHAWVIPVGDDFSNFASSFFIADALIRAGRAKNILICIGDNWTQNVDYHTPQSLSAADGAGAAVVAMSDDVSKWHFVDQCTVTASNFYGTMKTEMKPLYPPLPVEGYPVVYAPHTFQITPEGLNGFKEFGMVQALGAVTKLIAANGLANGDFDFMPHQTSLSLINYWVQNMPIKPSQILHTIAIFANITVATEALNLAYFEEQMAFEKNHLVMMALGPDMHCNSMLLKRG